MATIVIDTGNWVLTDEHVLELVKLKRGATHPVYFMLAKLAAGVEQAVADEKAAHRVSCHCGHSDLEHATVGDSRGCRRCNGWCRANEAAS